MTESDATRNVYGSTWKLGTPLIGRPSWSRVRVQRRRPVSEAKASSSSQLPWFSNTAIVVFVAWAAVQTRRSLRVYVQVRWPVRASRPPTACSEKVITVPLACGMPIANRSVVRQAGWGVADGDWRLRLDGGGANVCRLAWAA